MYLHTIGLTNCRSTDATVITIIAHCNNQIESGCHHGLSIDHAQPPEGMPLGLLFAIRILACYEHDFEAINTSPTVLGSTIYIRPRARRPTCASTSMFKVFFTFRSQHYTFSSRAGESATDHSSHGESSKRTEKSTSLQALTRVCSNVAASALVFVPIITLVVLITQGMFNRLVISQNAQTAWMYWADYGTGCVLSSTGWVADTCTTETLTVVTTPAFAAVGTALAQHWAAEISTAGGTLRVTTCILGGTTAVGWANLQFVAGYDYFPACLPTAPQDIAGMAMLETTIRDAHPEGLYFLTVYSDLDPSVSTYTYYNSDGTTQDLMTNPKRTLVTTTGEIIADTLGSNYIIYSRPLGTRYLVTGYCLPQIEEVNQIVVDMDLSGWSQGTCKNSKHPVAPGWACGHTVDNANELIVIQIAISIGTLLLFAGDIFVTLEGFRGVLSHRPVLTYAVLDGLERRKVLLLLLCFIVINALPGILYIDVARIYYATTNGFKIWCLSAIMAATFHSFCAILALSLLDRLPLRLNRVVRYSAPQFLYTSILVITVSICSDVVYQNAYNKFYAASPLLRMHVNGVDWPSGSYTGAGTPQALSYLSQSIYLPLVICFIFSVLVPAAMHFKQQKRFVHDDDMMVCHSDTSQRWDSLFMGIAWCKTNSFLTHATVPNLITSLPLEQSNAIKIGNKMYCKPSTQALMGFATVVAHELLAVVSPESTSTSKATVEVPNDVISIYALVPTMLTYPHWFKQYGKIHKNQYTPSANGKLARKKYRHTRGACVV
ncbi:Aste57867_15320 [Aphanomyces stellatus]|uniref:Aste57867_15320 protein n=1 Tax=Aphanomyces stellatus TaxID=120398 RepID=A0A485L2W3_9STRA|nr:hypothetical protein As57867_015264 [Aphanomyces stellatus]VFT92129.1 Aste57867_15320 [Aphanomyces stellatus]